VVTAGKMTLTGDRTLIVVVLAVASTAALAAIDDPTAGAAIVAVPAVAAAMLLLYGVLRGNRAAVMLLLFAAVFLMQAVFRVRAYDDKDVDFQVLIKIGVWVTVAAIALFHVRRWATFLLKPANVPALLFLLWLPLTAVISPKPIYTLVSAFTICACVVFTAYLFSRFKTTDIVLTVLASTTLFCAISIVVYFAVPEFGHYVYWVNEERFVSPRLAGIAGSANNMALISAFALVLAGLEARTLHRINRFIIPVVVVVCGAALIMTNSRVALLITCVIVFTAQLLKWRRLYASIFALSVLALLFAVLIPVGQEALLRAVSRSGSVGEITSLTGRTEIWYATIKLSELAPWTGYGYASSVFILPEHANQVGFATSHAHNLILQLLLTTGWIGTVLFILTVAGVILRAVVYRNRLMFGMIAFVLLNGLTESSGFTTLANVCSFAFAIALTVTTDQTDHEDDPAYQRRFS
jgi:O-antigen ligase